MLDRLRCWSLLAVVLAAPVVASGAGPAKVRIGVPPEINIFKQRERYRPLAAYLTSKIGSPVEFVIEEQYSDVLQAFGSGKVDGAFFGSSLGAIAVTRHEAVPLARPVNLDGTSTYAGRIFVRKDSGIRDVAGMKGKKMAYVSRATTAGYMFPLAHLKRNGVPAPAEFLGEQQFVGKHDAAIHAVLEGKADVGAAKNTVYDKLKSEDPRIARDLVVLAESAAMPSNALCVRKEVPPELQAKLKAALLELDKTRDGAMVLYQLGAIRFVDTTAADYAPVLDMANAAGLSLKTYDYAQR